MRLVTSHLNTDLDGLASMVAARRLVDAALEFVLPGSMDPSCRRVWDDLGEALGPIVPTRAVLRRLEQGEPLDQLIIVDTARRKRLGPLGRLFDDARQVEIWDTHGGKADGPLKPLPDAGATVSPMVLQIAEQGQTPTPAEAGLFLLGIHCDTGHLRYAGTTPIDHQAAGQCLMWGADLGWLERYLPDGLDVTQLRLMSRMVASMARVDTGDSWVALMALELDARVPALSVLLGQLRVGEGWPAAIVLVAEDRRISVIGRSDGALDVGALCRRLGGGGHPEAASAALRGVSLIEARARVVAALQSSRRSLTAATMASRTVFSLPMDATIADANDTLHRYRINALPLRDAEGTIAGVLSRREIDEAIRHGLSSAAAGALSVGPPTTVPPDADVDVVRRALLEGPSRLLVVGTLQEALGVITRSTVFRAEALDPPLSNPVRPPAPTALWKRAETLFGAAALDVADLGTVAAEAGVRALLIGGCVRDLLLKRPSNDIDVVVVGDAPALATAAARRFGGDVHVHPEFGTAHWLSPRGNALDLASARTESYARPGALPSVEVGDLRQDFYRRDFTINMMAMGISPEERGRLVDPFYGLSDLRAGTLRVVHGLSFDDDPTRAWRAARFAARFDFRLAPGTAALMQQALRRGVLESVTDERLGAELHRIFLEDRTAEAVRLLREWGLLRRIHPRLETDRGLLQRLTATQQAWAALQDEAPAALPDAGEALWIALGWSIPPKDRQTTQRLVAGARGRIRRWVEGPDRVRKALRALDRTDSRGAHADALHKLEPAELVAAAARDDVLETVRWWLSEGRAIRPAVDGHQLMAAGVPRGPELGRALGAARRAAMDGADADTQLDAALRSAGVR
ncbi:MAG: CBS domain-containing protein [Myxococcota bacterium]